MGSQERSGIRDLKLTLVSNAREGDLAQDFTNELGTTFDGRDCEMALVSVFVPNNLQDEFAPAPDSDTASSSTALRDAYLPLGEGTGVDGRMDNVFEIGLIANDRWDDTFQHLQDRVLNEKTGWTVDLNMFKYIIPHDEVSRCTTYCDIWKLFACKIRKLDTTDKLLGDQGPFLSPLSINYNHALSPHPLPKRGRVAKDWIFVLNARLAILLPEPLDSLSSIRLFIKDPFYNLYYPYSKSKAPRPRREDVDIFDPKNQFFFSLCKQDKTFSVAGEPWTAANFPLATIHIRLGERYKNPPPPKPHPHSGTGGPKPGDKRKYGAFQTFYLYADILEERFVGSGRFPILAHFPRPMGEKGPVYEYVPKNLVFYPLEPRSFDSIHVWFDDDMGKRINFPGGVSQVEVFIRQRKHY